MSEFDVIIVGAGAAGFMAAIEAGKCRKSVLLLDHAEKPAQKIRISGGGRCNFTNLHTDPSKFISKNPHFCKSALSRYTQYDFINLVDSYGIKWHEKNPEDGLGQLFCDGSSQEIIDMLIAEADKANVEVRLGTEVKTVAKHSSGFTLGLEDENLNCAKLVIATGGKSIPKMGATGWAYDIARQFGLDVISPEPALVPLTFGGAVLDMTKDLTGVSLNTTISAGGVSFKEGMVFTHRGLSGPSILQISSYWNEGQSITVNMAPNENMFDWLRNERQDNPKQSLSRVLGKQIPARLCEKLFPAKDLLSNIADFSNDRLDEISAKISEWSVLPQGTEGYRTAEVTKGGINTDELSSKTMECKKVPGLYFIGEAVDVTGWLGGYNFQWAWSSGWAAGQAVCQK
ncbi:MAG: aminoacetone oxidase family FAD-binding enzyme [Alphaproteobacteria bacterium]|nr:aminoacetone oxidase family FAD-binding enzyme [Alphaproteobacteria bacterium]